MTRMVFFHKTGFSNPKGHGGQSLSAAVTEKRQRRWASPFRISFNGCGSLRFYDFVYGVDQAVDVLQLGDSDFVGCGVQS
jgi:hypothetical protein